MSTDTVAIPDKRPYAHKEFVGRRKELEQVAQRVKQGKNGKKIEFPVINYWGIEGYGKSWLLRHLARLYRGPGRLQKEKGECKRTFTVLIDMAGTGKFEWTPHHLTNLLKPVIEDIRMQLTDGAQETSNLFSSLEAAQVEKGTANEMARSFVEWIISLTKWFVPIFLLDTVEQVLPETLSQIELHLIEPLVLTNDIILITAGRREVARWHRFAVRSRQGKPMELTPLSSQDTANQLQKQGFDLPGELVYDYSFGLAYASQVIAVALNALSSGHKVDGRFLRRNEQHLKPWLVALDEHFLQTAPPELRDALHVLCVLRIIRQGALPYLLASKDGRESALLAELEATLLVRWDPDRGVHLMSSSLRRLLSLSLRLQEPTVFAKRHHQAAEYYMQVIRANPHDCGQFLVEALYHMAYGYTNQPAKINALLKEVLQPDNFTIGGIEFLLEQLEKDEEVRSALSARTADRIIRSAQKLRQNVRRILLSVN